MVSFFPDFLNESHKANIKAQLKKNLGKEETGLDTDESVRYIKAKDFEDEESKAKKSDEDELLEVPGEFIFVIDRSGSMDGHRMELAKEALSLFVHSLPDGCKFNIYSFGSIFARMFGDGSEPYDEKAFEKSKEEIEDMDADMGGTEIYQPLEDIFNSKYDPTIPRHIYLLTDGAVFNPNEVIRLIKKNAYQAKVHTFGIGSGASIELIKGCAEAGGGKSYFISDSASDLQTKVIDALGKAFEPCLSELKVNFSSPEDVKFVTPRPDEVPLIYAGEMFTQFIELNPKF